MIAIIGLVFCWSVFGGIILGLVAVIIGFVARGRVKRGEATNTEASSSLIHPLLPPPG